MAKFPKFLKLHQGLHFFFPRPGIPSFQKFSLGRFTLPFGGFLADKVPPTVVTWVITYRSQPWLLPFPPIIVPKAVCRLSVWTHFNFSVQPHGHPRNLSRSESNITYLATHQVRGASTLYYNSKVGRPTETPSLVLTVLVYNKYLTSSIVKSATNSRWN